jgi:hypothetical protein
VSDTPNLDETVYRTILDTRNFEIRLFWQRSNYFLVLNTAIGTGFFVVAASHSRGFAVLLTILGTIASALWLCVNLGSKFWQVRWETRLHDEEEKFSFEEKQKLFAADITVMKETVERGLGTPRSWRFDRRLWHRAVLLKPSVTLMMTYLSCCFILAWLAAFIRELTLLV